MNEVMIVMSGTPNDYSQFRTELDRYFDSNHKQIDYSCGYQLDARVFDVVFNVEDNQVELVKEATKVVVDVLNIKIKQVLNTKLN